MIHALFFHDALAGQWGAEAGAGTQSSKQHYRGNQFNLHSTPKSYRRRKSSINYRIKTENR
jgi:hypothetical protein